MQAVQKVRPGYRVIDGQVLIYNANLLDDVAPDFFEFESWQAANAVIGEAPGRGTTFFVQDQTGELALRHYKRGGGIGRIVSDSYWLSGLTGTRPWREWHLLMQLHNQGLPVCIPVAARVVKKGLLYKADLITRRIMYARSWQDWMFEAALPGDYWVALGKCLRHFHNAGLYHHDLNIRNIMRTDEGRIYLIDFDQAKIRKSGNWQRANLSRLHRSIRKLEKQGKELHFSEDNWEQLMQGYTAAN